MIAEKSKLVSFTRKSTCENFGNEWYDYDDFPERPKTSLESTDKIQFNFVTRDWQNFSHRLKFLR